MDPTIDTILSTVKMAPESPTSDALPQTPTTPTTPLAFPAADIEHTSPPRKYTEPLYTEINIPLPSSPNLVSAPKSKQAPTSASPPSNKSRPRAHTLHSLSPFHRRSSSSSSAGSSAAKEEEWPRIKKEVKSKEVAAAMDVKMKGNTGRKGRSGTVDALAVVPAVLVLSAELFTPGEGGGKKGKWEDGMI